MLDQGVGIMFSSSWSQWLIWQHSGDGWRLQAFTAESKVQALTRVLVNKQICAPSMGTGCSGACSTNGHAYCLLHMLSFSYAVGEPGRSHCV